MRIFTVFKRFNCFEQRRTHCAGSAEELAAMTQDEQLVQLVCGSAKRALRGQTPAILRAYSFEIDNKNRKIFLRAHFAEKPSEDDLNLISIIETEIDADFLDHFDGETDIEVVAPNENLSFLSGGVAYLREGEVGETCC